jgi:hypothetical protein
MHVVAWRTEQEVGHNRNRVSKRFGIVPFSYRFEEIERSEHDVDAKHRTCMPKHKH